MGGNADQQIPLVDATRVALIPRAEDWRQAIALAGELLVEKGDVLPSYVMAMQRTCQEMGPYIVIRPGVALAHARPEEGALRPAVAFLRLDVPVAFGHPENDPVWLVIAFAGSTNESHIRLLQRIALLLGDEAALARIRQASSPAEVARIVTEASGAE